MNNNLIALKEHAMKTELTHNNEDYYSECHVYSDKKYDYAIVNGESITRYYGSEPGQYESYPIHTLMDARGLLERNQWISRVLSVDSVTDKPLYKNYDRLIERLKKSDYILNDIIDSKEMSLK